MSKKEFKPNNSPRNGKRTVLIVCTSLLAVVLCAVSVRSEERRVGKECL